MQRRASYLILSAFLVPGLAGCDCGGNPMMDGGADGDVVIGDGGPDAGPIDSGMMMPSDLFTPPTITECGALPAPTAGRCEVTAGSASRLIQGDVLTPGEVFHGGSVLVGATGMIECVGCDCSAMAAGATTIVCPDVVVSPALINAHDHATFPNTNPFPADGFETEERFEHRHNWRRGQDGHTNVSNRSPGFGSNSTTEERLWLELRQLMSGTTSIFGSGGPDGLLRNLDSSTRMQGLGQPNADYSTFPLGDTGGTRLTDACTYSFADDTAHVAGLAAAAYVPHVAEGIGLDARNEFLCMMGGGDAPEDLIEPQTAIIHGIGLLPADIAVLAAAEVELIWSPRSNISLYGETARVTEYAYLGVPIGLGTDWVRSGSMNMLRELSCADGFNANHLAGFFPDEQLWLMGTRNNAMAFNMDDAIGTLAVGLVADIALYDASVDSDHRAVLNASADDVVLVLRGGAAMYGDDAVVDALRTGCEPLSMTGDFTDVCGSAKRICLQDLGTTFAAFYASANNVADAGRAMQYPLFFCGEPEFEPTCLPARVHMGPTYPDASVDGSGYYAGMSSMDDMDGDAIDDATDNCPSIFNPIRPLDFGTQADSDGDGLGDACDPEAVDATDLDGDTIPNDMDNCPDTPNLDQADRDMDMIGDVCDPCPDFTTTAGTQSIYAVRCEATTGAVTLSDLVVTGVDDNGFYAQQLEGSTDYDGPDFSGIFVYTMSVPTVARGDVIDVAGTTGDYFGQAQITAPMITPVASGMEPAPLVVTTAEVATGGTRAEALESVLLRVEMVTAMGAPDAFGSFLIDDMLIVDASIYTVAPAPAAGTMYDYVQGPQRFAFDTRRIVPRDLVDVGFGALQLAPGDVIASPDAMVTLTVVLGADAPAGGASVTITPSPAGILVGPATIDVPAGMRSASAIYTASTTEMTGTVMASYMAEMDTSTVTVATAPALFFSEYVEGNSNNKAMEIVNAGGAMADLSLCELRRYTNGSPTVSSTVALAGTLVGGDVFVICNGSFDVGMIGLCDQTSGTVNHNGNDAYDLFCSGMVVDTFGQIGFDPSPEWTGGGLGTIDHVLTRDCATTMGDLDGSDAFDPSVGWSGAAWVDPATSLMGLGNRSECP